MEGIYFIFLGMKVRGTFNEEGKNNKEEKVEDAQCRQHRSTDRNLVAGGLRCGIRDSLSIVQSLSRVCDPVSLSQTL